MAACQQVAYSYVLIFRHGGPIIHITFLGQQVSLGTSGLPEPGNKNTYILK